MRQCLWIGLAVLLSGCAVLHHAQVGEIDNRSGYQREPFDIKLSELGVDFGAATRAGGQLFGSRTGEQLERFNQVASLFRSGRATGNPVFVEDYARKLNEAILERCPSGWVTNVVALRETADYQVISGEIVRIKGTCLSKK